MKTSVKIKQDAITLSYSWIVVHSECGCFGAKQHKMKRGGKSCSYRLAGV